MDLHRPRVAQRLHQRRHQEPKSTIGKSKYHENYDRKPTNLVGPVPDSDTDASLDGLASGDDGLIILLLLCKRRGVGRSRHANVQLGDSDVDAKLGERLDVLLDGSRHCADNEMALNTNTIDRSVLGLEALHEVEHSGRLVAKTFDVVVVDLERVTKISIALLTVICLTYVELCMGIGETSHAEGFLDVVGANGLVEYGLTKSTVLVEGLCGQTWVHISIVVIG